MGLQRLRTHCECAWDLEQQISDLRFRHTRAEFDNPKKFLQRLRIGTPSTKNIFEMTLASIGNGRANEHFTHARNTGCMIGAQGRLHNRQRTKLQRALESTKFVKEACLRILTTAIMMSNGAFDSFAHVLRCLHFDIDDLDKENRFRQKKQRISRSFL